MNVETVSILPPPLRLCPHRSRSRSIPLFVSLTPGRRFLPLLPSFVQSLDFPYKRSVMTWLPRDRWFKLDILAFAEDQDTPASKLAAKL